MKRTPLDNGLTRWVLELDSLTDGFLKTAVDANTAITRSTLVTPDDPEPDAELKDRRPLAQRRVDGIHRVAKKALKVDDGQVAGTAVTLLVTMTEEALRTGLGTAAAARTAGPRSPPRSPGSSPPTRRSFRSCWVGSRNRWTSVSGAGISPKPRDARWPSVTAGASARAVMRRRRGATAPTSDPPATAEQSLDNGVLLCWRCHLLHDLQGWQLERIEQRWWWTPPPWIDPTGTETTRRTHPTHRPHPMNAARGGFDTGTEAPDSTSRTGASAASFETTGPREDVTVGSIRFAERAVLLDRRIRRVDAGHRAPPGARRGRGAARPPAVRPAHPDDRVGRCPEPAIVSFSITFNGPSRETGKEVG